VTTDRGEFVVKEMVTNAGREWFEPFVEASFAIERRMYAGGLPMPRPIADLATGRALARVEGVLVRVHEYVDGVPLYAPDVTVEQAAESGGIVHRMHEVAARREEAQDHVTPPWSNWEHALSGAAPELVESVQSVRPEIESMIGWVYDSPPAGRVLIDSHRDWDPKNALLTSQGMVIVDWDTAGAIDVSHEAITGALDWAGSVHSEVDVRRVEAFAQTYLPAPVTPLDIRSGVRSWAIQYLNWFNFNVWRVSRYESVHVSSPQVEWGIGWVRRTHDRLDDLVALVRTAFTA
jgi:Ser/Thr protein kinase RdoA (MazF antagonist)